MTDIDFKIPEFEIDITEDVKHLHDEHRRLADNFRGEAWSHESDIAEARWAGDDSTFTSDLADQAAELHEKADLHEHTANVFAIILGLTSEDD